METFYKITKAQAEAMGKFFYDKNKMFDPFAGETKDGYYLVTEDMYQIVKERIEFKKVDFGKITTVERLAVELKEYPIK